MTEKYLYFITFIFWICFFYYYFKIINSAVCEKENENLTFWKELEKKIKIYKIGKNKAYCKKFFIDENFIYCYGSKIRHYQKTDFIFRLIK